MARSRLRVNWFSPLPPARSEVVDYAMCILPLLADACDLVVWAERSSAALEVAEFASVRRWDGQSWIDLNCADATVYHLANDRHLHGWIWDAARRHPGIVVLHDPSLHERAVEGARGAVVHTDAAFANVASLERCSVVQLDLRFKTTPLPSGSSSRVSAASRDDDANVYVTELLAAIERMMRTSTSIVGKSVDIVGGILNESGMMDAARAHVARRVAEELCRWVQPEP